MRVASGSILSSQRPETTHRRRQNDARTTVCRSKPPRATGAFFKFRFKSPQGLGLLHRTASLAPSGNVQNKLGTGTREETSLRDARWNITSTEGKRPACTVKRQEDGCG